MKKILANLCNCPCHKGPPGKVKHVMACCKVCPGCNLYIRHSKVMEHQKSCELFIMHEVDDEAKTGWK